MQTGRMETDLGVEVVGQAVQELALDGVLLGEQGQVVAQLVVGGDDGALPVLVELGATGAPKDLHDVQDAQVHQGPALGIVDLSALLHTRDVVEFTHVQYSGVFKDYAMRAFATGHLRRTSSAM